MEKESYSIDDILSEVKSRREKENEKSESFEIKERYEKDTEVKPTEETSEEPELTVPEEIIQEPEEEITEFSITEAEITPEPNEEEAAAEEQSEAEKQEIVGDEELTEQPEEAEEAPSVDESAVEAEPDTEEADENQKDFVDLLSIANDLNGENADEPEAIAPTRAKAKNKAASKKKKRIKKIIAVLLVLVLVCGIFGGIYIFKTLKNMSDGDKEESEWRGMSQLIENYPEIKENEASELSSLQDMIRSWYYNGAPSSSTHVLNVLLVGEDTRGSEILDEETRADAAIIASVNIDKKVITLTSILRDTYAYWENTPGDASTGEFGKINGAMAFGGIKGYINCIEKLYKIDIDNYVIVNFDSFKGIIDELGGVNLELTTAEINEINNHPKRYGNVTIEKTFEGDSGTMKLNGAQALAYCRIRYIDSDNKRADRQKTCLYQIFNEVQDVSSVTQLKVVKALLPYVKTGFKASEIVSIAKYALSQGWLGYDVEMITVPDARINEKGAGGIFYGAWCWKADFPQDAYYLQTMLYGKSPITLAMARVDILNCNLYGFFDETLTPCYAVIQNYNYGEVTTYKAPEEDTTTSN